MFFKICDRCKKEFNHKGTYDRHMNRLNKCQIIDNMYNNTQDDSDDESIDESNDSNESNTKSIDYDKLTKNKAKKEYVCNNCDKKFSTSSNLSKHKKKGVCKKDGDQLTKEQLKDQLMKDEILKSLTNEMKKSKEESEKQIKKLQDDLSEVKKEKVKEIKELKKEINMLKGSSTTINGNNNNNTLNSNSNNTNNIVLVNYGGENLAKLDKKKLIECVSRGAFQSTVKLTDAIHFDPDHPENHNIYISNMKNKYAMEYKNKRWNLVLKVDLIDKIYRNKKEFIEENLEEFYESLTELQIQSLNEWLNTDEDDDKIKKIKTDIGLLLFNKRNIPMNKNK
jgi:hypothetical protein